MVALTVLVIIFLILLAVGLLVFIGFFVVNKIFLGKLLKLMERYNELSSTIHSINFFKITILINSELPIKGNLTELKSQYIKLTENSKKIYDNLAIISDEINAMNLKTALEHINNSEKDIVKAENDLSVIKKVYDQFTSYGDAIDNIAQYYESIYEQFYDFFVNHITFARKFKPVIDLFKTVSDSITKLPNFKLKFDFKKTVNALLELRSRILTLAMALDGIIKFQVVAKYLKDSFESSELSINNFFREIDSQDLQMIKKQEVNFKTNFIKFMEAYWALNLKVAKKHAIIAIDAVHQLSNFVHIHSTTQSLIATSLVEIEKQTISVLSNKKEIKQSLQAISRYFIKDPILTKTFKQIALDIDIIEKLSLTSKAINSKTFMQKLTALNQIAIISKNIYDKKDEVKASIEIINTTLANVIEIVQELNDSYIYLLQLASLIRKLTPEGKQLKDIEDLIEKNLELLNEYAKQVVNQDHPDYKNIYLGLVNMNETISQLTQRVKTSCMLKSYSTKLIVYCNRYRTNKQNETFLNKIEQMHNQKHYSKCIEQLIKFINDLKKQK